MLSGNPQLSPGKMPPVSEQFLDAPKSTLAAQLSIVTDLAAKAIESVQKIIDLNLNAAKESTEDSANAAREFLAAKEPKEFLSMTVAQAQPAAVKAIAYHLHLAAIAAAAQTEIARAAEEQIVETDRQVSALVDEISRSAPAGSENVMAAMKSALGNASAGYEHFSKTATQAIEVLEDNLTMAATRFSQTIEQTKNIAARPARKQ